MTGKSFRNAASASWLAAAIGVCPVGAWSGPLARVDTGRVDQVPRDQAASDAQDDLELPAELRRQLVIYPTQEVPGTIVIDTPHTYLYYVVGGGRAIRYAIGVGREGFTWSGVQKVTHKAEWPDWVPPAEMIKRQQYLPRWIAGGPGNPLGARAIYLGDTQYRIHGTNDPTTIGKKVSSGCVRLTNEDVIDLYGRTSLGSKVVVLPDTLPHLRDAEVERSNDHRISSHQIPPQLGASGPGPVTAAFGLY